MKEGYIQLDLRYRSKIKKWLNGETFMTKENSKCWASSLGNCSEKISREHLISQTLFSKSKSVNISGVHWLKVGEVKNIGLNSLVSRNLCERHNNGLSKLDNEAKNLLNILKKFCYISESYSKIHESKIHKYKVNGFLLERWFLKTMVNLNLISQNKVSMPMTKIINTVFLYEKLEDNLGLYMYGKVGDRIINLDEDFLYAPLFNPSNTPIGGIFKFYGIYFSIFYLSPPKDTKNFYHVGNIDMKEGKIFQTIKFNWKRPPELSRNNPAYKKL